MVVRVVRAVLGTLALLVGLPLLLAGGMLWFAMQHQDPTGGYRASLSTVRTGGYAVIASDVDTLLRRDAPFARGGQTSLRLTARTDAGPAFVGLAPATDVARYLAGVPYLQVDRVRLARGPLPVSVSPVAGTRPPAAPGQQPFWLPGSGTGALEWHPDQVRGEQLALVVMDPQARAPLTVDMTAQVRPEWIGTTTAGLLVLGATLMLVAIATLAWPSRSRDIVYVVPPAQLLEIAARLGVPFGRPGPADVPESEPGEPEPGEPVPSVPVASASPAVPPSQAAPADPVPAGSLIDTDEPRSLVRPPDLEWPPPVPRERSDDRVTEEIVDRSGMRGRR